MSGPELRAPSSFFLVIVLASLISCNNDPRTNTSDEEGPLSINLRAITGSDQSQMFTEVKRASLLPKTVLHEFRDGIADRGQPFNKTDVFDPNLPPAQLIAAGVSKQYCIMSYWLGGYALTFRTSIFEFSDSKAREIWRSEGGLNLGQLDRVDRGLDLKLSLRDLKKIVESGWRHNEL